MKSLFTDISTLTKDKVVSFTTEDVVATGTTIRLQSVAGFQSVSTSSGQIVCIGKIGEERTELRRTSNSSGYVPSPTYNEITLRDSLKFDHPQDTPVYIVDWDRIDPQWAATVTGTKSTIVATPSYPVYIRPDQVENEYKDTSQTTGYYFVRFNETVGNTNSDWSDAIPFGGFDDNSVAEIKRRAVEEMNEEIDGKIITHDFLNKCLWEARRDYHQSMGKRPFRRKFNTVLGTALQGSFRIELPTDCETPFTGENIYGVRIGTNVNMDYMDKKEFDYWYRGKPHTFLTTAYATGDQDVYCNSVRDFSDSGAIQVEGVTISYSARGVSGGTLRVSTAGSTSASAGSDVWQNASFGLPDKFTVFASPGGSAYIYFNRPIDSTYANENIFGDYYSGLLGYDSDADILDEPHYDIFVDYLKFKIKERKSRGNIPVIHTRSGQVMIADADYQQWNAGKQEALSQERISTDIRIRPDISGFDFPN